MKPSLIVSLLLLSLLLSKAQAIRLDKGSAAAVQQKKQQDEESTLLKRSNNGDVENAVVCKDGECTGIIKNRKLVTTSISATQTTKNVKNEGNKAESTVNGNARNVKVKAKELNGLATSEEHRQRRHEHSPDLVDIMDYSPARRKPPIHN